MTFGQQVLEYYKNLTPPDHLPSDVSVMNPYHEESTINIVEKFYKKYYSDNKERKICFGINPGRFGAGLTGIPFTDPEQLVKSCGISNEFTKKTELSSAFIYKMIDDYGGPCSFYSDYFISAVSPLGYIKNGINLNYYDIKGYQSIFDDYVKLQIEQQLKMDINRNKAYSIGKGKNIKYLNYLNERYGFFKEIVPLPHPRWIMQYQRKKIQLFINKYLVSFGIDCLP